MYASGTRTRYEAHTHRKVGCSTSGRSDRCRRQSQDSSAYGAPGTNIPSFSTGHAVAGRRHIAEVSTRRAIAGP
eukprot:602547-Rhodomonas_salina.1